MLQIRPIDRQVNAGLSGFVSGAAGAAQGYASAEELKRRRELEQQQADAAQRRLLLAEQAQENQMSQFLERQRFQRDKEDRKVQGQAQAGRAFGAMAGQVVGEPQMSGIGAATGVPGFDDALAEIRSAIETGGMTPSQGTQALKMLGARWEATIQKMRGDEIAKQLQDEIALGRWNASTALGMEVDIDGDGEPDPIESMPGMFLEALKGGVDPSFVQVQIEQARQAISDHRAQMEFLVATEMEHKAQLDAARPMLTPEGYAAATSVLDKWGRKGYEVSERGKKEFVDDFSQAQLGNVPITGKSGVKYYVPRAQAAQAELDLKKPEDPEADRREWASKLVGDMLGQFRPDPLAKPEQNAEAARSHMATFNAAVDELLRKNRKQDPQALMRGPAPKIGRPGAAAVPSTGPASQADAMQTQPPSGEPATAPMGEDVSPPPLVDQITGGPDASQVPVDAAGSIQQALGGRSIADLSDEEVLALLQKFSPGWDKDKKASKPKKAEPKPGLIYKQRGEQ